MCLCAGSLSYAVNILLHGLLAVFCLDIDLIHKDDFGELLIETAVDNTVDNLVRCVRLFVLGSCEKDFLLFLKILSRNFCACAVLRTHSGCLHSDVLSHLGKLRCALISFNLYENDDLAAHMCIGCDESVVSCDSCKSADLQVLADCSDMLCNELCHCLAVFKCCSKKSVNVSCVCSHDLLSDSLNKCLELLILGNEVCLGVNLNCDCLFAVCGYESLAETFCSDSVSLLGCLHLAVLTKEVDCLFHVAFACCKSLLAVHHACAALLTKLFYHCSSNCHYNFLLILCSNHSAAASDSSSGYAV